MSLYIKARNWNGFKPLLLFDLDMLERLQQTLHEHLAAISMLVEDQGELITDAAHVMVETLVSDHRVFCCGNGGSHANAQSFVSKLMNKFQHERPTLPGIVLSSDTVSFSSLSSDGQLADVFARPFTALAQPGDVLVVLTASASIANITQVVRAAHDRDCRVIAITGQDGGEVMHMVREQDVLIRLPTQNTPLVHELQLFVLHSLCDLVDQSLFGIHDA